MMFGIDQIAGIGQGVAGQSQMLIGWLNRRKAKKAYEGMQDLNYKESDAYQTAASTANLAERQANFGIPEASFRFQEDMIGRSGAAALASAGSLRQGTMGLSQASVGLADQYRGLASMDAQQRLSNRDQMFQQRNIFMGQQENDFNVRMGYDMNERARLLGEMAAGRDQFNNGLQTWADSHETFAGGGGGGIPMMGGGGTGGM